MKNASVYISGSGQIPAELAERVQAIGTELQQAGFTVTVSVSDVEPPAAEAPASAPADATTGS